MAKKVTTDEGVNTAVVTETVKGITRLEAAVKAIVSIKDTIDDSISKLQQLEQLEEIGFSEKKKEIENNVKELEESYRLREKSLETYYTDLNNKLKREYDELQYKTSVEFERKKLEKAVEVASANGKIVVDKTSYKELEDAASANLQSVEEEMKKAIKEGINKETATLRDEKGKLNVDIQLLKKDIEQLNRELVSKTQEIDRLRSEINQLQNTIVKVAEASKPATINTGK